MMVKHYLYKILADEICIIIQSLLPALFILFKTIEVASIKKVQAGVQLF